VLHLGRLRKSVNHGLTKFYSTGPRGVSIRMLRYLDGARTPPKYFIKCVRCLLAKWYSTKCCRTTLVSQPYFVLKYLLLFFIVNILLAKCLSIKCHLAKYLSAKWYSIKCCRTTLVSQTYFLLNIYYYLLLLLSYQSNGIWLNVCRPNGIRLSVTKQPLIASHNFLVKISLLSITNFFCKKTLS
jgi:hypothetical protein